MPPILITSALSAQSLDPGDVILVAKVLKDKETGKPFTWRYFAAVVEVKRITVKVIRFGAPEGQKDEYTLMLHRDEETIHYLPEDEWPDGVHAFRTRLILEGRLDEAVS